MKTKLLPIVCVTGLSILSVRAADNASVRAADNASDRAANSAYNSLYNSGTVEQRIRETDVGLAIRQYERVQMEVFENKLKLDLLNMESGLADENRHQRTENLKKRISILLKRASELRDSACSDGKNIGGEKKTKAETGPNKIPLLGDIPFLGPLFQLNR